MVRWQENGGEIIFIGDYDKILKDKNSLTGKYLSGRMKINIPIHRKPVNKETKFIDIRGARENNLKDINAAIPLNMFTVITGVSGSGKSTLINDILYGGLKKKLEGSYNEKMGDHDHLYGSENIDAVELVDQSAIGKTFEKQSRYIYKGIRCYKRNVCEDFGSRAKKSFGRIFFIQCAGREMRDMRGNGTDKN